MQKWVQISILVAATGMGILLGMKNSHHSQHYFVPVLPTVTPHVSLPVSSPVVLTIPVLHISAPIEEVGIDKKGRMDVPKLPMDVGWYEYGYKPGEKGSAVIDGHYDTASGAGAVFYNLNKLQRGDIIQITDSRHHVYSFTVNQTTNYPFDQLPLTAIFTKNDTKILNLITCQGVWDKQSHNYLSRTVISSQLTGE